MTRVSPVGKGASAPAATPSRHARVFYGWWIVLASGAAMFINTGIGFYSMSVFYTPLEAEFGWSRASISAAMSLSLLGTAFLSPFVGSWSDRQGVRGLMIAGATVMGLTLASLSFVQSLWQIFVIFACLSLGRSGLSSIPVSAAIGNWFHERRGLALGLAMAGYGIGGLVMVPISGMLISGWGWRPALLTLAAVTWLGAIPPVALLMRNRPSDLGLAPHGGDSVEHTRLPGGRPPTQKREEPARWTAPELLRTRAFWLIVLTMSLVFFAQAGVLMHTVPLLFDRGLPLTIASLGLSITAGMGTVGKISLGALADSVQPRLVLVLCFLLQIVGLSFLMFGGMPWTVWVYAAIFGIGMGATGAVQPVLIGQCFGIASFGLAYGTTMLFTTTINALGPMFAGWLHDMTGGYTAGMVVFLVCYTAGCFTILDVRRPVTSSPDAREEGRPA